MSTLAPRQVIVIGGGLAGLVSAHAALQDAATSVVLLDKNAFLGGNSIKASSGINGAPTEAQRQAGIHDSIEAFYADTAKSSGDLLREPLVRTLVQDSAGALNWLTERFGIPLDHVKRLGGHGIPRTHHPTTAVGWTLTSTLSKALEKMQAEHPERVQVLKKARVVELLRSDKGVHGVVYQHNDQVQRVHGHVIVATGGFAGDKTEASLLVQHKPEYAHLPTTNGEWSTGDGIRLSLAVGAHAVDMDKVQIHPTGLVDPANPDAGTKFLGAEALRGVGGLLLDAHGNRFCDELGPRDYVTAEMWANKAPFYLVLNEAGVEQAAIHVNFYMSKGLMVKHATAAEFAQLHGMNNLQATFDAYAQAAATEKDAHGKKYFTNPHFDLNAPLWVAIVTPVLHFTMGGLAVDTQGCVLDAKGQVIPGLYAAGEVSGGVHGNNRLGGNSLLECVVFGRRAGRHASQHDVVE